MPILREVTLKETVDVNVDDLDDAIRTCSRGATDDLTWWYTEDGQGELADWENDNFAKALRILEAVKDKFRDLDREAAA